MEKKMVGSVSEQSGILGVIKEITRQLCDGELTKEQGQAIIEHRNCFSEVIKIVRDSFHVIVEYFKSLSEMISSGNYDWVNSDISEKNFPINGKGQIESNIELIHYGKFMSSEDIIQDMESKSLRPAILSELLAFGRTYPDKQREFPIVALGSVWRYLGDNRYVAFLVGSNSKRRLDLSIWDGGWCEDCRFAAVRK